MSRFCKRAITTERRGLLGGSSTLLRDDPAHGTKLPIVTSRALTIHGQAELVIQHAEAYQRLLDLAADAAAIVGIQQVIGIHGAANLVKTCAHAARRSQANHTSSS